jgi:hypothetical protein
LTISAVIRRTAAVAPWALACLACVSEPAAPAGPSSAPAVAGRGSALATVPAEDALASLAGDWVVRREVVGADGACGEPIPGTARLETLLGGRLLRMAVRFQHDGGPVEAEGLLAYDRRRESYQLVWASQAVSGMSTARGTGRLEGAGLVLSAPDGSAVRLRLVEGRLLFESAPQGGGPVGVRTVYERRPEP